MSSKNNIQNLIMSLYIIPQEKKNLLLSAIEKKTISEDKLKDVLLRFKKVQEEMGENTKDIERMARVNYIKTLKKAINDAIIDLQKINLEIDELIFDKQEGDPDNILDFNGEIWKI